MAKVDPELFLAWADQYFEGDIKVSKNEVKANSPFADEDHKHKLWMNAHGGKNKRPHGVYRCWKTDKKGDLINLVAELEGISYNKAEDIICNETSLATLADRLDILFNGPPPEVKEEVQELCLPEYSYLIDKLPDTNNFKRKSSGYLKSRKISTEGFYVCVAGDYQNRIIIPYYDCYDNLIYFNSRSLSNDDKLRYKGPGKDIGVGKGDVVFMKKWPTPGSRLHVTEGEFDGISLNECGFNGTAIGGKYLTENQIELIRSYYVTMCFDGDIAGKEAVLTTGKSLLENGFEDINYVRPPKGFKDWNQFLVEKDTTTVRGYIDKFTKPFNWMVYNDLIMQSL